MCVCLVEAKETVNVYVAIEVMCVCLLCWEKKKIFANMQSAILSCSLYENIVLQPVTSMFLH